MLFRSNKLEGYFEVTVEDPSQLEAVKTILKQSPKINTINEMETKKKLTKSDLKEMVRQELQSVLAEKKKAKDAADQATGLMERLTNFMNQLLTAIYPLFHEIEKNLQPLIDALTEKTTGWAEDLKKFFAKMNPGQLIEDIKNFFVGAWDTIKDLALNWKSTLIKGGLLFVGAWVAAQLPAAVAFATTAGEIGRAHV